MLVSSYFDFGMVWFVLGCGGWFSWGLIDGCGLGGLSWWFGGFGYCVSSSLDVLFGGLLLWVMWVWVCGLCLCA